MSEMEGIKQDLQVYTAGSSECLIVTVHSRTRKVLSKSRVANPRLFCYHERADQGLATLKQFDLVTPKKEIDTIWRSYGNQNRPCGLAARQVAQ